MAANRLLEAIATHMALHPGHGMAGVARLPAGAGMGAIPGAPQTGFAGVLNNITGSPLGQIGTALLAGGGGPLGNAAAMLAQMGANNRALALQYAPKLDHIGNQVGFLDPRTGSFTPTYTEPANDEVTQLIRHAGLDPSSPEGQKAYLTILQNREDPEVQIPLPNGGGTYVGPRSGFEDAVRGLQGQSAPPTAPASPVPGSLAPSPTGINSAVAQVESGNRDFSGSGTPIMSSAGARYAMQVLPSTAHNPGFGVTPAQNDSAAEYDRVGRDYLAALQRHYGGNEQEALAAYNAGPGTVDRALANGSPLPSQGYVNNVMGRMGSGSSNDIVTQAQQAIAAGADPVAVKARAAQMGVTIP